MRRVFALAFVSAVVLGMAGTLYAGPAKIVIVTDNVANEASYVSFLRNVYGPDAFIDVTASGYADPLSAGQKASLQAADLVIVSRQTNSANYDNEPFFWNGLETPVILHSAYLARGGSSSPRWRWLNGNADDESGITQIDVHDASDPIYDGVNIVNGRVTLFGSSQGVSLTRATDAGLGSLVASQVGGIDGAFIGRWKGDEAAFFSGGPQAPGGERIWFAFPSLGSTANSSVFFDTATEDGKLMLQNALTSMLPIPEPAAVGLAALVGGGALLRRRRRVA
jgi:hypothetical protein